jgi:hypothetical protein
MKRLSFISIAFISFLFMAETVSIPAQQTFVERFTAHNRSMSSKQPAFITPLVGADPRIVQYAKFSVAHQYTSTGTETVNYGNGRGTGIIVGDRFEFDFIAPPYIQHNSAADDDSAIRLFWQNTGSLQRTRKAATTMWPSL